MHESAYPGVHRMPLAFGAKIATFRHRIDVSVSAYVRSAQIRACVIVIEIGVITLLAQSSVLPSPHEPTCAHASAFTGAQLFHSHVDAPHARTLRAKLCALAFADNSRSSYRLNRHWDLQHRMNDSHTH